MSSEDGRVSVQTYVSSDQRERWREEAERLQMSQAEYVRTMVQAGRRSFSLDAGNESRGDESRKHVQPGLEGPTPGVDTLKEGILEVLRTESGADWDRLLTEVTDDVEERLEEAITELQSAGRIQHSPREGGYRVVDDGR